MSSSAPTPSPNGPVNPNGNGRGPDGRFAKGNAGGPGNPNAERVGRLRTALLQSVTPADVREVTAALLAKAKSGDVPSIRELLQRLLGPAEAVDMVARVDALEATLRELAEQRNEGPQTWQQN